MKKITILILIFGMGVTLLAGCGEGASEEVTEASADIVSESETVMPSETVTPSDPEEAAEYTLTGIVTEISGSGLTVQVTESEVFSADSFVNMTFPVDIEVTANAGDTVTIWFGREDSDTESGLVRAVRYEIIAEEKQEETSSAEPSEETVQEEHPADGETAAQPSEEIVHAMVDPLQTWAVEAMHSERTLNVPITPTIDQAVELAACAYFWENDGPWGNFVISDSPVLGCSYVLTESGIAESLRNRFGSGYSLSEFTNTTDAEFASDYNKPGAVSAFGYDNSWLGSTLYNENGQYAYVCMPSGAFKYLGDISITNIEKLDLGSNTCSVSVGYGYFWYADEYDNTSERFDRIREVDYVLVPDNSSDYGWIITQVTYK